MEEVERQCELASLITRFKENTLREGRDKFTAGFIRSRIDLLERYWSDFVHNHQGLRDLDMVRNNNEINLNELYSNTELQFSSALGYLYDVQHEMNAEFRLEFGASEFRGEPMAQSQPQLPRITLPLFSGMLNEWEAFRDMFRSMIHNHPNLSGVQKLQYLIMSVSGEALAAVSGLKVIEANYTTAWNLLMQRYDQKRLLTHSHMKTLVHGLPAKKESATELRALMDRVTAAREALRALEQPVEHWDAWMVFFLSDGMDLTTRKDWEKTVGSKVEMPTFEKISEFLNGRIRALQPSCHTEVEVTTEKNETLQSVRG